jgi:hypothetical protein
VHRVAGSRRHLADLLRRRPLLDTTVSPSEDPTQLRRMDQVREMMDLPDPGGTPEGGPHRRPSPDPTRYPRGSSRI